MVLCELGVKHKVDEVSMGGFLKLVDRGSRRLVIHSLSTVGCTRLRT